MPAIPVLAAIAAVAAPELIAAAGAAILETVGASAIAGEIGLSAATVGSAALGAAGTIASGGSAEDALKSAVLSGVGSAAGSAAVGASGLTGTAGSALGGAVSGGTQAALTGKNVGQAALKGGLASGLTSGIKQGLDVLNPPTARELQNYSLSSGKTGLGLNPNAKGETGLTASFDSTAPVFNEDGTVDYSFSGVQTPSGEGLKASIPSGSSLNYQPDSTNKELSKILSKGLMTNFASKPSGSTGGTTPAKSTTIGGAIGASPMAFGAADVLGVDTTPGEVASKKRAGTEEYPWGEPTGTSALKQGLGI